LGLLVGSAVKINDSQIGKITRITPGAESTLYEARLDSRDVHIRADARATVVAEFIGTPFVVLETCGSQKAPLAGLEAPLPLQIGISSLLRQLGFEELQRRQFQDTLANLASLSGDVQKVTATLAKEINDPGAQAMLPQLKSTLANVRQTSDRMLSIAETLKLEVQRLEPGSLLGKVHSAADYVNKASSDLAGMVQKVRPDVEGTIGKIRDYAEKDVAAVLADMRKVNTELVAVVGDIRSVSSNIKDVVVLNRDNLDELILHMKSMAGNLNAAAKEIRRNPWRLLAKPAEKETKSQNIYDAARAFAEGAGELDDAVSRMNALRDARPEGVKSDDPELKKVLTRLEGSFEKFRAVEDKLWEELSKP
jgi:ABC-type transporter Mla subunit MlaD